MQTVAYYRVSTKRQGVSGLGLEAQRSAVLEYAQRNGGQIIREFTEVESGKRHDNRPELMQAIPFARRAGAVLVVAKLDRLARNLAFLSSLMDSDVDFVACDNPHATRFTIHILAAVAELEAKQISERTKAALAAAKARGVALGSHRPGHWDGRESVRVDALVKARAASIASKRADAAAAYRDLAPLIADLRNAGLSLNAIAKRLNEQGHRTRRGCAFTAVQVSAILERSR